MVVQVGTRVAVLVPLPDNDTAVQCVNPARCHPVQLTTQAGRTRCTTLLISYSIRVICTWLYTRYVHKKVQSSICSYIRGHVLISVWFVFSLCIFRSGMYPIRLYFTYSSCILFFPQRRALLQEKGQNSHCQLQNQE